jgi:hypothetical protein
VATVVTGVFVGVGVIVAVCVDVGEGPVVGVLVGVGVWLGGPTVGDAVAVGVGPEASVSTSCGGELPSREENVAPLELSGNNTKS